jgi:hypothetical protein
MSWDTLGDMSGSDLPRVLEVPEEKGMVEAEVMMKERGMPS